MRRAITGEGVACGVIMDAVEAETIAPPDTFMAPRVFITGSGVLAPTGSDGARCFEALSTNTPGLQFDPTLGLPSGRLHPNAEALLEQVSRRGAARRLDRTALLAIAAGEQAMVGCNGLDPARSGVIVGTSRGATISLEKYHSEYLRSRRSSPSMSPVTTAVTLPAAVAGATGLQGPVFSVSAACTGGLTAMGTAFGLIQAGQARAFLAGGAEASLTSFTAGSLEKLGLLSHSRGAFPVRPGEPGRDGTALAEGSALFVLEEETSMRGRGGEPLAEILAFAQQAERGSLTGISDEAEGLQQCLEQVLGGETPDLVIGHFAGTPQGDEAEARAYRRVLRDGTPVTAVKWSTGHMLAASPSFSVAMALGCMQAGRVPGAPYATRDNIIRDLCVDPAPLKIRTALVTALGFGGGAAAMLLRAGS